MWDLQEKLAWLQVASLSRGAFFSPCRSRTQMSISSILWQGRALKLGRSMPGSC